MKINKHLQEEMKEQLMEVKPMLIKKTLLQRGRFRRRKVRKRRGPRNHESPVKQKQINMNEHIHPIEIGAYIV